MNTLALFAYGQELCGADVARKLGIQNTAACNRLADLADHNYLLRRLSGRRAYYRKNERA